MFIVFAPHHLANPSELHGYPAVTQGFMNHHGEPIKYDPSIPELESSLPRHGEPPKTPYEKVGGLCLSLFRVLLTHVFCLCSL